MSNQIKSYKLSPQLKAEIGCSQKNSSPKPSFKIEWSKIPFKAIAISAVAIALCLGGYIGIKKTYERIAYNRNQKALQAQKDYEARLATIKDEVAKKNLSGPDYVLLSQNYLEQGDGERAEAAAELGANSDKAWRDGYVNLARIYMSINKFNEAKGAIASAVAIDPICGNCHYLAYLANQELNNSDEAKIELAKAKKFGFDMEIGG